MGLPPPHRVFSHKVCTLSALAASTLFLGCYIWYYAHHGATRFPRQGAVRDFYLALFGSHTILAVVIVPLVLTTLHLTLPLWFYVSVTGVVVYWMPYHLYPQVATPLQYVR